MKNEKIREMSSSSDSESGEERAEENVDESDNNQEEVQIVSKKKCGRPRKNYSMLSEAGKTKRLRRNLRMSPRHQQPFEPNLGTTLQCDLDVNTDCDLNINTDCDPNILTSDNSQTSNTEFSEDPTAAFLFTPNLNPKVNDHIKKTLNEIVTKYSIGREAVNCLLELFHPFFPKIPKDARTLRRTPKSVVVRTVSPGLYVHIGVKNNLELLVSQVKNHPSEVIMDLFADGVAFQKISKQKSFWVILGRFDKSKSVFCIGVYNGTQQPASFNDMMDDFIKEAIDLSRNGITIETDSGPKTYFLHLRNFIGDSLAQADLAYIKHPTGQFSCPYCNIKGVYHKNRMTFSSSDWELRTDVEFREQSDNNHHNGTSQLFTELMQFPSSSPIDYLHNVLIGACKRFFTFVFGQNGAGKRKGLLSNSQKLSFKAHIERINLNIPTEIHHECRNIKDLGTYKATDYRVMLLKIGPAFLKKLPFTEVYNAFLLLCSAITLLCDPDECLKNNNLAKDLILEFIKETSDIFGDEFVVSVIHRLSHLPDMVMRQRKPLDSFSAFPFESFISTVKKDIHSPKNVIQQIFNRRIECFNARNNYFSEPETEKIRLGKLKKDVPNSFTSISFDGFKITPTLRNGFLLTKQKKIVLCQNIRKDNNIIVMSCKELTHLPSLFTVPIEASLLNHFLCKSNFDKLTRLTDFKLTELERKMFYIPYDEDSSAFAPFRKFNLQ